MCSFILTLGENFKMSGISCNRNKKNGKKSKFVDAPVIQVKSVKLETTKTNSNDGKSNAKSENDLRKCRKSLINDSKDVGDFTHGTSVDSVGELDACIVKRFKTLNINNDGENMPCASYIKSAESTDENTILKKVDKTPTDPCLSMTSDQTTESSENLEYASYKFYTNKNSKSIKFTNQVTVLYFNGEDILCESMEPLKKELDQQIRNKEMRKEHLMSKGQFDNVYLF